MLLPLGSICTGLERNGPSDALSGRGERGKRLRGTETAGRSGFATGLKKEGKAGNEIEKGDMVKPK